VPPALCRGEATPLFPLSAPQWSKGRAIGRIPEPHPTCPLTSTMSSTPFFAPIPSASASTLNVPEPALIDDDYTSLLKLIKSLDYQHILRLVREHNVASRPTDNLHRFLADFDAAFSTKWSHTRGNMHEDIVSIVVNICANKLAAEDGTLSLDNVAGPMTCKQDRAVRELWDLLCECLVIDECQGAIISSVY